MQDILIKNVCTRRTPQNLPQMHISKRFPQRHKTLPLDGSTKRPKNSPSLLTSALCKRQDRVKGERSQLPLREYNDQKENAEKVGNERALVV
jgi:hypothetical protein